MQRMKIRFQKLSRTSYAVLALALAVAGLAPALTTRVAHAFPTGSQIQVRSIKMSDSRINQTGVSYQISFKPGSATYTVKGIIVDFCGGNVADTPIIDDSNCTIPTGFSVGTPTVNVTPGITGYDNLTTGGGSWTTTSQNSGRTLRMVNSTGVSIDPANTNPYTFVLSTAANPSTAGTFYARLITYTSDTGDVLSYTAGNAGSTQAKDYGGFALSTANVITITAKVQEALTFCVSGVAPGPNCGATGTAVTAPTLTLGHSAANILDSSAIDTAQAFTQLSTNANGGAIIRMRNTAVSGGLNAGTNSIPPQGTSPSTLTAGTASFGVNMSNGSGGTGTLNGVAPYNTAANYAMDATTAGDNVLSTYGDSLASASAPVNNVGNTLTFAATASNTTPAGIYTANIILIATGTF
ncbi:MAG TPA: hypothetical protein VLH86_04390 [Patescibacteria group bacterium]|nr:hypothetical protein [Patescibacteria group bacterium]